MGSHRAPNATPDDVLRCQMFADKKAAAGVLPGGQELCRAGKGDPLTKKPKLVGWRTEAGGGVSGHAQR